MKAQVAVIKTTPGTVIRDYARLMDMAGYRDFVSTDRDTLIKLNLSWSKYFPASSSQPWQLEGVVAKLIHDGFGRERLFPVENKTVVTNPVKGAVTGVEWVKYGFKGKLLKLNEIFPEGIEIPKMFIGKQIIHLPTVKTHGHSITTGAIKNAFGGLLKEVRHYAHKYIHEVLVDLMIMQKECGDGAGPRTMVPKIKNFILASGDSVAIDSVAARMMGFKPMDIPYIRMCHDMGLGVGDPAKIEVKGEDISGVNFGFEVKKSLVIYGDQLLRLGHLRFLERAALQSPLVFWAPLASNIYHDLLWYPIIGKGRIKRFMETEGGRVLERYRTGKD
jgi:hypothetical protein